MPNAAQQKCDDLIDSEIIIDNDGDYTVSCIQDENNDNDLYCECIQADRCVEEMSSGNGIAKTLYQYRSGDQILEPFSYKSEYYWRNVGCLAALAIGFRLIGYLVLAFKFRKANR